MIVVYNIDVNRMLSIYLCQWWPSDQVFFV